METAFYEKDILTIKESAVYFNIGINKLWELTSIKDCPFLHREFGKRFIIRTELEKFILDSSEI